jgi:E3 ubiquitin-protein ligase MYCBP2
MSEGPLSDNESEGSRGRTFHRSISMGTNGAPWSRREGDGRVIMMRKRNNSSGEMASGESLFCLFGADRNCHFLLKLQPILFF